MASDSLTFHDLPGHCGLVNIPFLFPFLRVHEFISKPVPLHLLQHTFVASYHLWSMFIISSFSTLQLQERGQHVSQHSFTVRACGPHVPPDT